MHKPPVDTNGWSVSNPRQPLKEKLELLGVTQQQTRNDFSVTLAGSQARANAGTAFHAASVMDIHE